MASMGPPTTSSAPMNTMGTSSTSPALASNGVGSRNVTTTKRVRKSGLSDVIAFIVALFVPPLGVFLEVGCHADFFINILLTILGWFPGVLHALYICFIKDFSRVSQHSPIGHSPHDVVLEEKRVEV